jgi:hypothetical protein
MEWNMSSDEQFIKAVAKLIELTQTDLLQWERSRNTTGIFQEENYKVEIVFLTQFESHNLRLYRAQRRIVPLKTTGISPYATISGAIHVYDPNIFASGYMLPTEPYWTTDTVLEVIDGGALSMYKFPSISAIDDLYKCVVSKTSRIEDLVSKLAGPKQ